MLRRKMLAAALATGLAGALVLGGCQGSGSKGKTADGKDSVRFMVGGSAAELEQYKKAVDGSNPNFWICAEITTLKKSQLSFKYADKYGIL